MSGQSSKGQLNETERVDKNSKISTFATLTGKRDNCNRKCNYISSDVQRPTVKNQILEADRVKTRNPLHGQVHLWVVTLQRVSRGKAKVSGH